MADDVVVTNTPNFVLPERSQSQELVVVGTNDDHYNSMVNDPDFYNQMQQRNMQYNQNTNITTMSSAAGSNNYLSNNVNLDNPALTAAGQNAADGATVLVTNTNEDWVNNKWRPAMSWMYMLVCICDFILFPIFWTVMQAVYKGSVTTQWQPLTLEGAGLFHIAMGAVLGISAYGRTQEKIQGVSGASIGSGPGTMPATPITTPLTTSVSTISSTTVK